ncbi:MAG: Dethiobiotin synthetase [Leptolyngbyaceae cyanobacterium bins.302]|nr:Dethiobiotin synthetase [Leptolyngbyaceae cyanobacterium bins.302]
MDYQTAHNLLITQGMDATQHSDSLLSRLKQGSPPVPGQVTQILLALKVVLDALKDATAIDRDLAYSLLLLSIQSHEYFDNGDRAGVEWAPMLKEDLDRISGAVESIFRGS